MAPSAPTCTRRPRTATCTPAPSTARWRLELRAFSVSRGVGFKTVSKLIIVESQHGGKPCPPVPELNTRVECHMPVCPPPVHCDIEWSEFSLCSRDCGPRTKTRTARIVQHPLNGGAPCPLLSELTDTIPCFERPCLEIFEVARPMTATVEGLLGVMRILVLLAVLLEIMMFILERPFRRVRYLRGSISGEMASTPHRPHAIQQASQDLDEGFHLLDVYCCWAKSSHHPERAAAARTKLNVYMDNHMALSIKACEAAMELTGAALEHRDRGILVRFSALRHLVVNQQLAGNICKMA